MINDLSHAYQNRFPHFLMLLIQDLSISVYTLGISCGLFLLSRGRIVWLEISVLLDLTAIFSLVILFAHLFFLYFLPPIPFFPLPSEVWT